MKKRTKSIWNSLFAKKTDSQKSVTSPENSSDETQKQPMINVANLIALAAAIIAVVAVFYTKWQFEEGKRQFTENISLAREEVKQTNEQFLEQMQQAKSEYKYQRSKDSMQSIEDEQKFQENIRLSQKQAKALKAITDYNIAAQKPFFQSEFKIGFKDDARNNRKLLMLKATLKNAGIRPSSDLWAYVVRIQGGLNGFEDKEDIKFSSLNGIPPNQEYYYEKELDRKSESNLSNVDAFYLYVLICYKDPILGEQIQKFYYKWEKETQNVLEASIPPASSEDVETIESFLKKNNRVPYCSH